MATCLVLVLILYVAVGAVTVGVVPWNVVAGRDLADAARAFLGEPLLAFFVLGGAVTALTTTLNASFLWGTKSLQVLCQDGFLPARWGASHPRYATPHWILTGVWALSALGLLLPFERATLNAHATIGGLAIFVPVLIASVLLPRRCPKAFAASTFRLRGALFWISPAVGVLLCVGAIVTLVVELVDRSALLLFFAWIAAGALYVQRISGRVRIAPEPGWE
jgi:APA family basic amino acid/polyamine antiporter